MGGDGGEHGRTRIGKPSRAAVVVEAPPRGPGADPDRPQGVRDRHADLVERRHERVDQDVRRVSRRGRGPSAWLRASGELAGSGWFVLPRPGRPPVVRVVSVVRVVRVAGVRTDHDHGDGDGVVRQRIPQTPRQGRLVPRRGKVRPQDRADARARGRPVPDDEHGVGGAEPEQLWRGREQIPRRSQVDGGRCRGRRCHGSTMAAPGRPCVPAHGVVHRGGRVWTTPPVRTGRTPRADPARPRRPAP